MSLQPSSVTVSLSAVVTVTGERRRRSTALLEQVVDTPPGQQSIRLSISRAEHVLRLSERQRELERRRDRAALRARQLERSKQWLVVDDDDEGAIPRSSPQQPHVRKTRSTPSLLDPDLVGHSHPVVTTSHRALERARVLPSHLLVPGPRPEPTNSKFSASSTGSKPSRTRYFSSTRRRHPSSSKSQGRPRTASAVAVTTTTTTTTNGIKAFGSRLRSNMTPSKSIRKEPSFVNVFRDNATTTTTTSNNNTVVVERTKYDEDNRTPSTSFDRRGFGLGSCSATLSSSTTTTCEPQSSSRHCPSSSTSTSASTSSANPQQRRTGRSFFRSAFRTKTSSTAAANRSIGSNSVASDPLARPSTASSSNRGGSAAARQHDHERDSSSIATTCSYRTGKALEEMRQGESGGGGRESKTRWVSKLGRTIKRNNNRLLFKQRTAIVEHEREDNDELTFQLVERGITLEGRSNRDYVPAGNVSSTRSERGTSSLYDDARAAAAAAPRTVTALVSSLSNDPTFRADHYVPDPTTVPATTPIDALVSSSSKAPRVRAKTRLRKGRDDTRRQRSSSSSPPHRVPLALPDMMNSLIESREHTGPISQVRGATTDLADLLSGFETTRDFDTSRTFATVSSSTRARQGRRQRRHGSSKVVPPPLPHAWYRDEDDEDGGQHTSSKPPRRIESIEFLGRESNVPLADDDDVPEDLLRDLINAVDDHISEVRIPHAAPLVAKGGGGVEGQGMRDRGFADEGSSSFFVGAGYDDEGSASDSESSRQDDDGEVLWFPRAFDPDPPIVVEFSRDQRRVQDDTDDESSLSSSSSSSCARTNGFDLTVSSFEGHVSTAAGVLRDMLDEGARHGFEDEEEEQGDEEDDGSASLGESVREALEIGRPSAGDRMFDHVDSEVSLSALVARDPSLPPSPIAVAAATSLSKRPSVVAASFSLGHFRHESSVSSSEGTESTGLSSLFPSSPTPNPISRRPQRSSLTRYSQQDGSSSRLGGGGGGGGRQRGGTLSSSDHAHSVSVSSSTTTSSGPSGHSTELSISSIATSPCPIRHPRDRRIPMLTTSRAIKLAPAFEFPTQPEESDNKSMRQFGSNDAVVVVPRSQQQRNADSISAHEFCRNDGRIGIDSSRGSALSTSEMISNLIILEEEPDDPARTSPLADIRLRLDLDLEQETCRDSIQSETEFSSKDEDGDMLDSSSEDDYDFTARDQDVTRKCVHLGYEADVEIKSSRAMWPDTDRSREIMAHFDAPKTYRSILDFLADSRQRFPTLSSLYRGSELVVGKHPCPASPPPSSSLRTKENLASPGRSNDPTIASLKPRSLPRDARERATFTNQTVVAKVHNRQPLGLVKVLGEKSVNVVVDAPSISAIANDDGGGKKDDNDALSPFTALPPRIGFERKRMGDGRRLRGPSTLVAKTSSSLSSGLSSRRRGAFNDSYHDENEDKTTRRDGKKKKTVDTTFLGKAVSNRRQAQLNLAARKLEGATTLSRGRGGVYEDEEDVGDNSDVCFEARGEATDEFTFAKTPPTSIVRPRGPSRRHIVSSLR